MTPLDLISSIENVIMQTVFKAITGAIKGFVQHYQRQFDSTVLKLPLKADFWASDLGLLWKREVLPWMDDPEVIQQDFPRLACVFTQVLTLKDLCHEQLAVWGEQTPCVTDHHNLTFFLCSLLHAVFVIVCELNRNHFYMFVIINIKKTIINRIIMLWH